MTCFWDGILQSLDENDFQIIGMSSKPSNITLIQVLKQHNKKTIGMKWNNQYLTDQNLNENFEAIQNYNQNTMSSGYLCSTFDPFLFLVSDLFKFKIQHNYINNTMMYEPPVYQKILRFQSDRGHFWRV